MTREDKDEELKRKIKEELGKAPAKPPVLPKTQAEKDVEVKDAIKKQLASGMPAAVAKAPIAKDDEMKQAITKQLNRLNTPPVKYQPQKDEETKAALKQQFKSPPETTRAEKDSEMKAAIKKQLATQSTTNNQSEKDEEMKGQIQSELRREPMDRASQPLAQKPTGLNEPLSKNKPSRSDKLHGQIEKDAEMKREIQSSLRSGHASTTKGGSQAEHDAKIKEQTQTELNREAPQHHTPYEQSASETASYLVGDNANRNASTSSAAAYDMGRTGGVNQTNSIDSSDFDARRRRIEKLPRAPPTGEREQPGAFSVATRAYGGMPAWIRQQAEQNRETQNQQATYESNLPPEMRGQIAIEEQSSLPPEMRTSTPLPETSPDERTLDVLTTNVSLVETKEVSGKRKMILYAIILIIVVSAVVGIVIGVTGRDDNEEVGLPSQSPSQSPTCRSYFDIDVQSQCSTCRSYLNIDVDPDNMDGATRARYDDFLSTQAPKLWPEYNVASRALDYCAPQHLALVWLANEDVEANQTDMSVEYRLLLRSIFFQTDGNGWRGDPTRWLTDNDECDWEGVLCDDTDVIVGLDLNGRFRNIFQFPAEIHKLTALESLNLSSNRLIGTVPTELGNLINLETMDLGSNDLNGSFAFSSLFNLINLRVIVAQDNALLNITIPDTIGKLSNLETLYMKDTGKSLDKWKLPPEIGMLSNLKHLNLEKLQVSGQIPTEVGTLNNLEELNIGLTSIEGTLPTELGNMRSLKFIDFTGKNEDITGTLPTELGKLAALEHLILSGTGISGTLPSELGLLKNITIIRLSRTSIEGTLPTEILTLDNLETLDFSETSVSWPFNFTAALPDLSCLSVWRSSSDNVDALSQGGIATSDCTFFFNASFDPTTCGQILKKTCDCSCKDCENRGGPYIDFLECTKDL